MAILQALYPFFQSSAFNVNDLEQEHFSINKTFTQIMKKYEVFEHTADVGIKARGADLGEAFEISRFLNTTAVRA